MASSYEVLGRNIKVERTRCGLTQAQLAEKIGSVEQTVGRWERGTAAPTIAMLCKVADALLVSTDALLGRDWRAASIVPPLSAPQDIAYRSQIAAAQAAAQAAGTLA